MAKKQCPNCGARFYLSELKDLKCPYCGSAVKGAGKQSKTDKTTSQKIEHVIPFSIKEEQAKKVKKDNARKKLYRAIIICLTLFSVASIPVFLIYKQKEQEQQRIEQRKERQEEADRQRQEAANLKAQQDKINDIANKVLNVANIFYSSREEYGHLRQDFRKRLVDLGFTKEKEDEYYGRKGEKFSFYSNSNTVITVYLNSNNFTINKNDDIRHLRIYLDIDDFGNLINNFKTQLQKSGFVEEKKLKEMKGLTGSNIISNLPSNGLEADKEIMFIRIGKENIQEEKRGGYTKGEFDPDMLWKIYTANWDAVSIDKEYYSITCYSKQGIDGTNETVGADSTSAVGAMY